MIPCPDTLGFPNEKIIRHCGRDDKWQYFCEPVPGWVVLLEPVSGRPTELFFAVYPDNDEFQLARGRTREGGYLLVPADSLEEYTRWDVRDLLTASCLIHAFSQEREAA